MQLIASTYLSKSSIKKDGVVVFPLNEENWLKECYQKMELDYPKFHKMDNLSKMAVLSLEMLKSDAIFNTIADDSIEMIFANTNASQNTDLKFIDSYKKQGSPSPSLFVYTLPNILTGEIAIKNKWYGENTFFVAPSFDATLFTERMHHSAQNGKELCLCGWVESKLGDKNMPELEECFLFLVALNKETSCADQPIFASRLIELYKINQTI